MNEKIRDYVRQSRLDVYGLGAKRVPWEDALERFADRIVDECCLKLLELDEKTQGNHNYYKHAALEVKRHFEKLEDK